MQTGLVNLKKNTAVFCMDSVRNLQTTVNDLVHEVSSLKAKWEDLESRSRQNNIRVVGLKEGMEQIQAVSWMAKWLHDILGHNSKPVTDQAHRSLHPKLKVRDTLCPMIIRLHYYWDRTTILQKASVIGDTLQCEGKRVHIFSDLTATQSKRHGAFAVVKCLLHGNSAFKD